MLVNTFLENYYKGLWKLKDGSKHNGHPSIERQGL